MQTPVITLTTDFGIKDGFIGTLKGVIWNICHSAQIADISHAITPQNIFEGAFTLWRAYSFFPSGSIHIAIVDPGVGTNRRPIAARIGYHTFVGPDNGLFTPIYEDADKNGWMMGVVHLTNEKYFLPNISRTFHGRDLFAPVAAYLANGVPLADLGPAVTDPIRIQLPRPEKTDNGWRAHITVVDVFGNCTTDLPAESIADRENILFRLHGREVRGLVESYGHRNPGDLVALVDSENFVEIAVVNGNAAHVIGIQVGDVVEVVE
jgi:S-adenosylmethionine hydrolase